MTYVVALDIGGTGFVDHQDAMFAASPQACRIIGIEGDDAAGGAG